MPVPALGRLRLDGRCIGEMISLKVLSEGQLSYQFSLANVLKQIALMRQNGAVVLQLADPTSGSRGDILISDGLAVVGAQMYEPRAIGYAALRGLCSFATADYRIVEPDANQAKKGDHSLNIELENVISAMPNLPTDPSVLYSTNQMLDHLFKSGVQPAIPSAPVVERLNPAHQSNDCAPAIRQPSTSAFASGSSSLSSSSSSSSSGFAPDAQPTQPPAIYAGSAGAAGHSNAAQAQIYAGGGQSAGAQPTTFYSGAAPAPPTAVYAAGAQSATPSMYAGGNTPPGGSPQGSFYTNSSQAGGAPSALYAAGSRTDAAGFSSNAAQPASGGAPAGAKKLTPGQPVPAPQPVPGNQAMVLPAALSGTGAQALAPNNGSSADSQPESVGRSIARAIAKQKAVEPAPEPDRANQPPMTAEEEDAWRLLSRKKNEEIDKQPISEISIPDISELQALTNARLVSETLEGSEMRRGHDPPVKIRYKRSNPFRDPLSFIVTGFTGSLHILKWAFPRVILPVGLVLLLFQAGNLFLKGKHPAAHPAANSNATPATTTAATTITTTSTPPKEAKINQIFLHPKPKPPASKQATVPASAPEIGTTAAAPVVEHHASPPATPTSAHHVAPTAPAARKEHPPRAAKAKHESQAASKPQLTPAPAAEYKGPSSLTGQEPRHRHAYQTTLTDQ